MMTEEGHQQIELLLWEHLPLGVLVLDLDMHVQSVNPAFCQFFNLQPKDIIGYPISVILEGTEDWKLVWSENRIIQGRGQEYPEHNLYVMQVIFPIQDADLIVCLMLNMSHDLERQREHNKLRQETIKRVNEVVDNQMKVVQEIAGLLGETTAETKVSLLKIIQMLKTDQ